MLIDMLNDLFKWMPYKEQEQYERKLIKVMKRLKIEEYHFNWDRSSCYIEFQYEESLYRLEHSIQKAKEKGIIVLRNGLDCLSELVQSLEDLCEIIERGTYQLDTWLTGMKQLPLEEETPEYLEEVHISYKSTGKQKHSEYNQNDDFNQLVPELSQEAFERNQMIRRARSKERLI
jgi:glycosyltransferase A (GT-A) superfamily protein (DUF2064 family)